MTDSGHVDQIEAIDDLENESGMDGSAPPLPRRGPL
jgi:hypothetical protein